MDQNSQSTGNAAYVEFERVSKTFDGRTLVVRDLDLQIRKGEFLTLLGPSGSGKTTCLMMLAGFETPTAGVIRIGGRAVQQVPPRRRGIGMVFQNYALFPHMTVSENLAFPLEVRGIAPERRRDGCGVLQLVRLEAERGRRTLSGASSSGWRSRALVFEPGWYCGQATGRSTGGLREKLQYGFGHSPRPRGHGCT